MQKILSIDPTGKSPEILFDAMVGKLNVKGYSLPANALEFYTPLMLFVDEYVQNAPQETELNFHFEYINTSSSKVVYMLVNKFEVLVTQEKDVTINWYYDVDDQDMLEMGKTFKKMIRVNINLIPVSED